MPRFALPVNNKIENIFIADSLEIAQELWGSDVFEAPENLHIGWIFENNKWQEPEQEPQIPPYPTDGKIYVWDKAKGKWIEVSSEA